MNATVVVILVAAIVLAGIAILAFQYLRTRRLRERFGPEYARAVREAGDRRVPNQNCRGSKSESSVCGSARLNLQTASVSSGPGALCRQDLSTIQGVLSRKPTIFLQR